MKKLNKKPKRQEINSNTEMGMGHCTACPQYYESVRASLGEDTTAACSLKFSPAAAAGGEDKEIHEVRNRFPHLWW